MLPLKIMLGTVTLLLATTLAPALAETHRISDTQTGWYYYYNQTEAELIDIIEETGSRIIDIEIHSTSPLRFTAAFVKNSGEYASGWWWYFGLTHEQVGQVIDENSARLIDIERYEVDGADRFAIVMVPNTGSQNKAWWWYVGVTDSQIGGLLEANDARLVDLESYVNVIGRRVFAVIMISNTGDDETPWGWFYNTPVADVVAWMNENNMRILEFEVRNPSPITIDAILISNNYHTPATWWWYYNVPADEMGSLAGQAGSRIVDIDPYEISPGNYRYNLVLLNNSSDLTVEVAHILDWGADGSTGLYLKEVEGGTLAALQPDVPFEPASTLKAIHNFHAIRQVMFGNVFLSTMIPFTTIYIGSCPVGIDNTAGTLQSVLTAMMVNSDNAATRGIADYFGANLIESTARNVAGMTSTELNHTLGCGNEAWPNPNRLTLSDAGRLYEGIETTDLLNAPHRDLFYSVMQNQDTASPWWFTSDLFDLVDEEAANQGYGYAASFKAAMRFAWKPGGYTFEIPAGVMHEYVSVAGVVTLPICSDGWETKSYVFGVFCDDASQPPFNKVRAAAKELFRDLVATHMRSCPSSVPEVVLPTVVQLEPNVPNPFNPRTEVYFSLNQDSPVQLTIHDLTGREVARLASETYPAGRHAVTWNGRDQTGREVASGTYLARVVAEGQVQTRKMVLLR